MGQQTSTTFRLSDVDPGAAKMAGTGGGTPSAQDVTYGQDDYGTEFKVFGATAGCYMLWDESVDSLLLVGTAAKLRLGTFGSSIAGSGVALSASNTAAFRAYGDDGGAAISPGVLARVGEFRHLLTYTAGNREQEAVGVIGKVVSVAGTNRHNMCGVMGSYETKTSLTVGGQAATTDTWCQAAIIGRVGGASITIDTNGVLAGVAAMSNVATALAANNGIYPAFYAGKWASTETWSHGIYIQHNAVDKAFQVGELSSTSQTGIHLTSANPNVVDSFADDNNTTLGDAVYSNIRARTMLFKACAAGTIVSVKGQLKFADEADMGPGVFAGVQGYMELYTDLNVKSGGKFWGVDSSIEAPTSGTLTVDSGGIAAGLHAELTGSGTATQASGGVLAGLYIDEQITSGAWGYGVYVTGADKAWYSSNTLAAGSTATNSFEIAVTEAQTNASGYSRALYVSLTSTGDKTGTGEMNAMGVDITPQGDAYIATPIALYTASCDDAEIDNLWGIYLYMDDIGGSATVTTKYGMSIGIDNGDNATTCGYLRLYEHSGSTMVDYVMDFPNAGHGAATYFLHAGCTGGMLEVGDITNAKTCILGLRCTVGGTTYVIPMYED